MNIQLSDHFDYRRILRFTLPSIGTMIFISIYGVVDGFFVSNFVGKTAFTAVNFVWPVLMILGTLGFLFGTGGSALISKIMGEGDKEKANREFSMIVYVSIVLGIIVAILGIIFMRPIASLLGAKGEMLESGVLYARIITSTLPFVVLQYEFHSLFITAEKPQLGLVVTILAGVTNMVLDALFMAVFKWGVPGAAAATAASQFIGGIIPLIYFARPNSSLLRLGKTVFDGKALLKVFTNGSSELMSNISMSIVNMLYNIQLLKYVGEDGVAAYGVLMYVNMIFIAIFIGYSVGVAPIFSYNLGAQNHKELKGLLKKSLIIISCLSVAMLVAAELLGKPLSHIFVGYDESLLSVTERAFMIYSFSFLFSGLAIFGSSFFTALNDGLTSALISFMRTLIFQIAAVMMIPIFFGVDGIWISVVVAEVMAVITTAFFMIFKRKKYHY